MKKLFYLLFLSLPFCLQAQQSNEEAAVIASIQQMFDAMRAGDSTALRSVFHTNATMLTTFYDKEGISKIHAGSLEKFIAAVGTPHEEIWDEKIWSYEVKIDANLASVWTEYTFYLGDKMLHCGVNAFQLFKSEKGWKIFHVADTRRKIDCQTE